MHHPHPRRLQSLRRCAGGLLLAAMVVMLAVMPAVAAPAALKELFASTSRAIPEVAPKKKSRDYKLSVLNKLDPTLGRAVKDVYTGRDNDGQSPILPVGNTMGFPWRYVGYLEIQRGTGEVGTCTGTMLSRHIVITAAHCLYDARRGYTRNVTFFPGLNGSKAPMGEYKAKDVFFLQPIEGELDNNFDIAFVVLERSPYTVKTFSNRRAVPVGVVDDRHFEQSKDDYPLALVAAGYPTLADNDPLSGKLIVRATTEYRNSIILGKNNQFEHMAITREGTSGGPIFAVDPLYNQFALIGLISAQRTWSTGEAWAVGIKINPFSQQRIRQIVAHYEPDYNPAIATASAAESPLQ